MANTFYNIRAEGIIPVANSAQRLLLLPTDGTVVIELNTDNLYAYNAPSNTWILIGSSGSGITIGSSVIGGTSPAVLYVGSGNVLAQDPSFFVYDDVNKRFGVGVGATPGFTGDFQGTNTVSSIVFSGTGTNDMSQVGITLTSNRNEAYQVFIDSAGNQIINFTPFSGVCGPGDVITGATSGTTATVVTNIANVLTVTNASSNFWFIGESIFAPSFASGNVNSYSINPDTFFWTKGGTNFAGSFIPITTAPQLLDEGVQIQFSNASTHVTGSNWTFTVFAQGIINTNKSININGLFAFATDTNNNISIGNAANNLLDTVNSSANISIGGNAGGNSYITVGNINIGDLTGVSSNGSYNTNTGFNAGLNIGPSSFNCLYGATTGPTLTNGSFNTLIGNAADVAVGGAISALAVGDGAISDAFGIALGSGATAATNEFALANNITNWKFNSNSYILPTAFPPSNALLQSSSTGLLTWTPGFIAPLVTVSDIFSNVTRYNITGLSGSGVIQFNSLQGAALTTATNRGACDMNVQISAGNAYLWNGSPSFSTVVGQLVAPNAVGAAYVGLGDISHNSFGLTFTDRHVGFKLISYGTEVVYNTLVGVLNIGDALTAAPSGATGMIGMDDGVNLNIGAVTGVFTAGDVVTDTNTGATFNVVSAVASNITRLYATQADGTTETASTSLTNLVQTDVVELYFTMNAFASVNYYWKITNGVWSAPTNLTTNIPNAGNNFISWEISSLGVNNNFGITLGNWTYKR